MSPSASVSAVRAFTGQGRDARGIGPATRPLDSGSPRRRRRARAQWPPLPETAVKPAASLRNGLFTRRIVAIPLFGISLRPARMCRRVALGPWHEAHFAHSVSADTGWGGSDRIRAGQRVAQRLGSLGVHNEHKHTAVASGPTCNVTVVDVDANLASQSRDAGAERLARYDRVVTSTDHALLLSNRCAPADSKG